jgi:cupin 2 domain-containing protein
VPFLPPLQNQVEMNEQSETPVCLLSGIPADIPEELVEVLLKTESVRIERIVSAGQQSPPGFWYDQAEHEWVVVLSGAAELLFEDADEPVRLERGDAVDIPAGRKHRVEWTSPDEPTVWLAIFYQ